MVKVIFLGGKLEISKIINARKKPLFGNYAYLTQRFENFMYISNDM